MRARILLLVLAILAVAAFAVQNWHEFTRTSTLTFGVLQAEAPLGLILLTLLGVAVVVFLAGAGAIRTQSLMESRRQAKALHAQRELADKAEASRFTDLRQMLDAHLRDTRQRETLVNTELDKTMAQHQRELRNQLEQMYHLLTSRLAEIERRIDNGRVQRGEPVATRVETVTPTRVMPEAEPQPEPEPLRTPPGRERV